VPSVISVVLNAFFGLKAIVFEKKMVVYE